MTDRRYRKRGYTNEWDKLSREFKRRCSVCLGCWVVGIETPTEFVDHVKPLSGDQAGLLDVGNLQPSCRWHHDNVKRSLELQWRLGQLPESALRLDSVQAKALTRDRYAIPVGIDGYQLWTWADRVVRPYPYRD